MTPFGARAAAGACALLASLWPAAPLSAEPGEGARAGTVTPPGERLAVTPTGVDMRSGQYAYSATDLSIGDAEAGGIALTRSMNTGVPGRENPFANLSHNWDILISEKRIDVDGGNYTLGNGPDYRIFVHFGGRSETFDSKFEDSGFQQTSNNWRASLVHAGARESGAVVYTYTATDGTVAQFRPLGGLGGLCGGLRRCAYVSSITHPDGTRFELDYDPGTPTRLRAVTSNRGYALLLQYGTGADANHVVSACVINLALQPRPADNACPANAQATTSYDYVSFEAQRRLASVTDAGGQVSSFAYSRVGGTLRMGFLRPGDTAPWMTNALIETTDNEGLAKELVDAQRFADDSDWDFAWTFAPQADDEVPQVAGGNYRDPAGNFTQVHYGFERRPAGAGPAPLQVGDILWQITPSPAAIVDPLGRTTTSNYCDRQVAAALAPQETDRCLVTLLQSFTGPDGRVTEVHYDGETTRNVTEVRQRARPGSLQANGEPWPDIVTRATYSCINNVVCNRPTSRTDANGNTTSYTYDPVHGGLLTETGPAVGGVSPQVRHSYAPRHAWLANGSGGHSQAASPVWLRISTSTCRNSAPTGNAAAPCASAGDELLTLYDYGPDSGPNNLLLRGQTVSATGAGITTTLRTCFTYDSSGRRIGETRPNAGLANCPAAQTSAQPFTSNQRYDAMGRVTGTISAPPNDAPGNPFLAVRNSYDGAGRLVRVETGSLAAWQSDAVAPAAWSGFTVHRTLETFHDTMGRKVLEVVREGAAGPARSATQYSYDVMGRLECTAVRMNAAAFGSLPASACTHSAFDPASGRDRISRNLYDAAGQRVQLREGVGVAGEEAAEASWAHNADGQLAQIVDGNGNRAEFRYDGHGRRSCWLFPSAARPASYDDTSPASALATAGSANGDCVGSGDFEAYGYDPAGNRTWLRKRDGSVLGYSYDALNRLTVKTVPDRAGLDASHERDVFYAYDLRGLQTQARFDSPSGEGISNVYDGFGRLVMHSTSMGGVTRSLAYAHDNDGNRTAIAHSGGIWFGTQYDGLGRPFYLSAMGTTGLAYAFRAAHGGVSQVNRVWAATGHLYDGAQRPSGQTAFFFGAAGGDVAWAFARNAAGQIASLARDNDAYAWTGHYPVARAYVSNGLNQYVTAGNAQFDYDDNGNLVSDGSRTYTYDVENRLVGAGNVTLRYDPLGRLAQVAVNGFLTTSFLYDGDALVAEYDGSGSMTRRHVHWVGADVPMVSYAGADLSSPSQLFADQQGSIVAHASWSGAVTSVNRFDEYGIPGAGNSGRFQYTGQIWLEELGMYYYKARVYSPTLGRFLQVDPIGYDDQFNLYAYVGNDPVNRADPTGLCGLICDVAEKRRSADMSRLRRLLADYAGAGVQVEDPEAARGHRTSHAAAAQWHRLWGNVLPRLRDNEELVGSVARREDGTYTFTVPYLIELQEDRNYSLRPFRVGFGLSPGLTHSNPIHSHRINVEGYSPTDRLNIARTNRGAYLADRYSSHGSLWYLAPSAEVDSGTGYEGAEAVCRNMNRCPY